MSSPADWRQIALNQATESENKIHSDDVAKRFGFRGGLVPGVTVFAYLVHPAVVAWGADFLARGWARAAFRKPLYDGRPFHVAVTPGRERAYSGEVRDDEGTACGSGEVALPDAPRLEAPARRGDAPVPPRAERPEATRAELERQRERGMGSLSVQWKELHEMERYVKDVDALPDLLRLERGGFANAAFTLGLANWILAANVKLGPWIHVESELQLFAPIAKGVRVAVESRVVDLFSRGGHEFVDLDVSAFLPDGAPALRASHRAIYVLRAG